MTKHRCFEVTTPEGHAIRIHGDPQMAPETLDALMRMADLAHQQFSAVEVVGNVSDTRGKTSVRALHRTTAMLCGVDGCDRPATGEHAYCKKHDMRYRRHGDPSITLRPWARKRGPKAKGV